MELPEDKLVPLIDKIGEYSFRIIEGADARIQVCALLAQIYAIGKKK
jgi:replication factor C small subunit